MQHRPFKENPIGTSELRTVGPRGRELSLLIKLLIALPVASLTVAAGTQVGSTIRAGEPDSSAATQDLFRQVIDGVKESERAQNLYERVERVEMRKQSGNGTPFSVKVSRVIPAGTGMA